MRRMVTVSVMVHGEYCGLYISMVRNTLFRFKSGHTYTHTYLSMPSIYIYSRYYSAFWNFTSEKLFLTTLFFVYLYYHCTNISSLRIINLLLISYLKIRRFKLKKNLSIRITLGTKIKVSSIFSNFPFAYSKFKNWNWSWRNFT